MTRERCGMSASDLLSMQPRTIAPTPVELAVLKQRVGQLETEVQALRHCVTEYDRQLARVVGILGRLMGVTEGVEMKR